MDSFSDSMIKFDVGNISLIEESDELEQIMQMNTKTSQFGLALTEQEALEIVESRNYQLDDMARLELGTCLIAKIIDAFCDSPYIYREDYQATLQRLVEIFYEYRDELALDVSDDDLIDFMKESFGNECKGSLESLEGNALDQFLRIHKGLEQAEIISESMFDIDEGYDDEY